MQRFALIPTKRKVVVIVNSFFLRLKTIPIRTARRIRVLNALNPVHQELIPRDRPTQRRLVEAIQRIFVILWQYSRQSVIYLNNVQCFRAIVKSFPYVSCMSTKTTRVYFSFFIPFEMIPIVMWHESRTLIARTLFLRHRKS